MSDNLRTPKYATKEVAQQAVELVIFAVMSEGSPFRARLKRHEGHIVVLVPAAADPTGQGFFLDWPDCPLRPVDLYQHNIGDPTSWVAPFDNIARMKAMQLWSDRNDDRAGLIPHLVFSRDTVYWGGVKRAGIVVACSGVQPWFDKMISGMVADAIIALAQDGYENDSQPRVDDFFS